MKWEVSRKSYLQNHWLAKTFKINIGLTLSSIMYKIKRDGIPRISKNKADAEVQTFSSKLLSLGRIFSKERLFIIKNNIKNTRNKINLKKVCSKNINKKIRIELKEFAGGDSFIFQCDIKTILLNGGGCPREFQIRITLPGVGGLVL